MSVEVNIINEVKKQILLFDDSFSDNCFITQNISEQTEHSVWIRLSIGETSTEQMTISQQDRIVPIKISYYKKSAEKAKYDSPSDLKDLIMQNMPVVNRPYWRYMEEQLSSYDIDLERDGASDEYEGFQLFLEMRIHDSIKCQPPIYITDENGNKLRTEDGYLIISE